jgi:small ligand-binding sensory domain FIST
MKFAAALSTEHDLDRACESVARSIERTLDGDAVDLCIAFASPHYGRLDRLPATIARRLGARRLIGCSGGGIIGAGLEVEDQPALCVTAATLPDVELRLRAIREADLPDADAPPAAWTSMFDLPAAALRGILVLPEPYTFPADRLLAGLDYAYPGRPKFGGLASGGQMPGQNSLFADDACHHTGAAVLAMAGNVSVDVRVAQGCRPLGKVGRVTACEGHHLIAVDGRPALQFLQEQVDGLDAADRDLVRRSPMFLGIAMDPFAAEDVAAGDFLIRNILGYDRSTGMLAFGGTASVGRQVQLHLRDRRSSADDLLQVLERRPGATPQGALLFSCLGRGKHLYGEAGHDSRVLRERIGDVPIGGFFCNGEIGPVGASTFLHGYTSSIGLLAESGE